MPGGMRAQKFLISLTVLVGSAARCSAQLSAPVASDDHVSVDGNKFLQREAEPFVFTPDEDVDDSTGRIDSECPQNIALRWMTEVSSSVYSTPLIADLFADGHKDILVPSFVHYLEVLEAETGAAAAGFPAFHRSQVHASPMLVDIDNDGVLDIAQATYNGQVLFYRDDGTKMWYTLYAPRLQVSRKWFEGLDEDPIDRVHADVIDPDERQELLFDVAAKRAAARRQADQKAEADAQAHDANADADEANAAAAAQAEALKAAALREQEDKDAAENVVREDQGVMDFGDGVRRLLQDDDDILPRLSVENINTLSAEAATSMKELEAEIAASRLANRQRMVEQRKKRQAAQAAAQEAAAKEDATKEAKEATSADAGAEDSENSGLQDADYGDFSNDADDAAGEDSDIERADSAAADGKEAGRQYDDYGYRYLDNYGDDDDDFVGDPLKDKWDVNDDDVNHYFDDYDDMHRIDSHGLHGRWEDETYRERAHDWAEPKMVWVDAHIMCNPVVGDLEGEGTDTMIVAVSYFFDRDYYDDPAHEGELDSTLDISKYVAGGIVAYNLTTKVIKWQTHLDLSTDHTKFRAYIYSAPVLADLNGDGKLEVIVGTSMGFLYALDHKGDPIEGWPIQMGEIQGAPLVADLNGDGKLEVFAADDRGNIAMFSADGKEIWERHIKEAVAQGATAGDIDGDGELEIVFGTASGRIWAVSGADGSDRPNFPFKTDNAVMAPVLITRLLDGPSQHLITTSFDGRLYMIDGATGCADTVDLGETSYSMVLADDLDGNGKLDLLVSTMNGNLYYFETPAEYHPLKTWTSQMLGANGQVARHDYYGVYANAATRDATDHRSTSFQVGFTIVDKRPGGKGPYKVKVVLEGLTVGDMNAGSSPIIGMSETYDVPGAYTLEIPCPMSRAHATLHLIMTDPTGLETHDRFSTSFHTHFHKLLKWLLALPFALAALSVLALRPVLAGEALPE